MSKKKPRNDPPSLRPRGRPKSENPKTQTSIRLDQDLVTALEQYRQANDLNEFSDAIRHALRVQLRQSGFVK